MLQVGQTLWYVNSDRRRGEPCEVRVKKVGRKWAELEPAWIGRVNIETLWIDGGQYASPGRCYYDREQHAREVRVNELWRDLRNRMPYSPPTGMTENEIATLRARILKD